MKESLVEQLLSRIMNWEDNKIVEELPKIQFMAEMMQYVSQPHNDEEFNDRDTVRMIIEKVTHMEINALRDTHLLLQPVLVVRL